MATEKQRRTDDVDTEAEAAAAEAARIGGEVAPLSDDPAREPLEEAGQGEAEGFEQAEELLIEHASHGDMHAARRAAIAWPTVSAQFLFLGASGPWGSSYSQRPSSKSHTMSPVCGSMM